MWRQIGRPRCPIQQPRETHRKTKNGEPSMNTLVQQTMHIEIAKLKMISRSEPPSARSSSRSCVLDLSKSRANYAALEVLQAYNLTGNFHVNLEIVLKDLGASGKVTHEIAPMSKLPHHPDCRHVVFRPNENIHMDEFSEIIRSIKARIGFDAARWWIKGISPARAEAA
jgi:hypothetical protein